MEHKLAEQSTHTPAQGGPTTDSPTYANIARDTQLKNPGAPTGNQTSKTSESNQDRRFNLVVYGMKECQKGTSRQDRTIQDTDSATSIIANIDNQFMAQSMRDCFRLGKYTEGKNRPTLVKLTRAQDVTYILANRRKLAACPNIWIKPDMNARERAVENILLKKRRELINSGLEGSKIKLRGKSLIVNNKKLGTVNGSTFTTLDDEELEEQHWPSNQ